MRHGWITALVLFALVAVLPFLGVGDTDFHRQLMLASIYGLLVVGFNLGFGFGGQLALGQVAVFAGGAYAAAILFNHGVNELSIQIVVAIALAAFIGIVTGLPGLRLSHFSLALVAFFLILLIGPLTNAFESETGGVLGLPGILEPKLFGISLSANGFYAITVVAAFLGLLLFRNLVVSRYGHSMINLSTSPALARSLGISPFRLRVSAYVLGALPAGVAGVFYAYYSTYVIATSFQFTVVILLLAASIVGGTRSVWGAPVACAILIIGPDSAQTFEQYSVLIYGLIITLAGLGLAAGLGGLSTNLMRRLAGAPTGVVATEAETGLADAVEQDEKKPAHADLLAMKGQTLVAKNVKKRFGGVEALRGADLEAKPGLVTAIIGANGAGKTTLLNAVSGLITPDEGEVRLDDAVISGLAPNEIARAGLSRTFQTPQIPEALTVLDVAASGRMRKRWIPSAAIAFRLPIYNKTRREDYRIAMEALKFVGLEEYAHLPALALPLGRRRILEVARAIAAEPAVILLDEPAAGLDPDGIQLLHDLLGRLRDAGATVVLIEHNVSFVMGIADTVVVMDVGAVIATGTPEEVRRDEKVIASYLGRRHSEHVTADQRPPSVEEAKEVEDVV